MGKTVADYPDAVRRIAEADVPADATTQAEVKRALNGADAPQVTREVADGIADSLLTEERVIEAIESSGEIPTEGELDAVTSVADDYDMSDRVEAVQKEISDRVATVEDVEGAVRERQDQAGSAGRPTFREDVEAAVDSVSREKEIVGESKDQVVSEQAVEVGAPSRSDYEQARASLATGDDQVAPADVLEDPTSIEGVGETTANNPATVIRSQSGEAVALAGAPSQEAGEAMAEELGAEYTSFSEINDSIGLEQGRGKATLTINGEPVEEVDVV